MNEEIRVLLVEDDDNDAEMALRVLTKAGLTGAAVRVRDGQEALDLLLGGGRGAPRTTRNLRLIVLDLKLPRVDGLDLLSRLRADPRTWNVPVVVLTSSMLPADVSASYRAGANSFLVKTVAFESQAQTLREVASYWLRLNVTAEN